MLIINKYKSSFIDAVTSKGYEHFMFFICILYTLTAIPLLDINSLFKNVIIFGSLPILFLKLSKKEGDNRIFWLFIFSFFIQIASWVNSLYTVPEFASSSPQIKFLSALFLFIFMSFWINGSKERALILYASLIISFILTAGYDHILHNSLALGMAGKRVDFGMHNAQFTSMLSVVVFGLTIYIMAQLPNIRYKLAIYGIGTTIIIFSLFSLVISQSRQVWLALIIVALLSPLFFYRTLNYKRALSIYFLIAISCIALFNVNFIQKRVMSESEVIEKVVSGDWNNIPMTSVGIRVNSWLEASQWIAKSPILGTDQESIGYVIRSSEKFKAQPWTLGFGHLHNFYIETLVAYGLIGILFLIMFYKEIIKNIIINKGYQEHILLASFLIFWFTINFFESYNSKELGLYAQNIILAGMFTYRNSTLKNKPTPLLFK